MTDEAITLKACPFCGGEAVLTPSISKFRTEVNCSICECGTYARLKHGKAITAWNTRSPDIQVSKLVSALEQARRDIVSLAVSGTDRIDELCDRLKKMDPSPIWPIPFPDPPERTWQPIVRQIDAALAAFQEASND